MVGSRAVLIAILSATTLLIAACSPAPPPPPPPAPPPAPPPVPGPQTISERTLLTMASDLAFSSGSYTLTRAGRHKLDDLLPTLTALAPTDKITVYGYTDDRPIGAALKKKGVVDNLDLSSKRADAVVRYLSSKGVNPSVISAKGRGETHPLAPNDNAKDRAQNRRIEVVVEQPAG
jgi:flagellar motor protein MotB